MMLLQVSCSHRKLKSQVTSYSGNQKLPNTIALPNTIPLPNCLDFMKEDV